MEHKGRGGGDGDGHSPVHQHGRGNKTALGNAAAASSAFSTVATAAVTDAAVVVSRHYHARRYIDGQVKRTIKYPRSEWLRSEMSLEDYLKLVRLSDYNQHAVSGSQLASKQASANATRHRVPITTTGGTPPIADVLTC